MIGTVFTIEIIYIYIYIFICTTYVYIYPGKQTPRQKKASFAVVFQWPFLMNFFEVCCHVGWRGIVEAKGSVFPRKTELSSPHSQLLKHSMNDILHTGCCIYLCCAFIYIYIYREGEITICICMHVFVLYIYNYLYLCACAFLIGKMTVNSMPLHLEHPSPKAVLWKVV